MFARGTCSIIETLQMICDAFGISLSEFFEYNENRIYASEEEVEMLNK